MPGLTAHAEGQQPSPESVQGLNADRQGWRVKLAAICQLLFAQFFKDFKKVRNNKQQVEQPVVAEDFDLEQVVNNNVAVETPLKNEVNEASENKLIE